MRERWTRSTPELRLDHAAVGLLLRPVFPDAEVAGIERTKGGLMNTNIRVELSGRAEPVLLRLYQRDPALALKEMRLGREIASRVPVARFIHFAHDNPVTGRPYALMEWIDGKHLETVVPTLDDSALTTLGASVGRTLAAIHSFTFDKPGFFDADLRVPERIDIDAGGLLTYLRHCLIEGRGGRRLGPELTADAFAVAEREGHLLDEWLHQPCLVHADFNGSNILIRQSAESDDWEVAAVLDWEFAFSGSPAFDFGNLLRPPLQEVETFFAEVTEGYCRAGGVLPQEWRRIARIADLFAWADFLNRPETTAPLIESARAAIGSLRERD
ncbi:phosphotransferase [Rhodospirillaceae bacterium SYSU D60014]|uniref:phosphotransferase family protein n=1 Tax=Virgifigura deserti TaxID=2268457 RepID=UPI000E665F56